MTTLFVAGNTMAMSVRERTTEIAVMRTLGFPAATIFVLVVGEGLVVSIIGGAAGAALARLIVNGEALGLTGGFIPAFGVNNMNVVVGLGLSALIGLLAGGHPGDDGVAAEDRRRAAARRVSTLARREHWVDAGLDHQLQPALDDRPQGDRGDDRDGHRDGGRRLRDDDGDRAGLSTARWSRAARTRTRSCCARARPRKP